MLGLLALAACGGGDSGGDCDPIAATLVARIEVSPSSLSVADGESVQLTAKAYSCDGSQLVTPTFTWQSSDASTVSVSSSGMAVGVKLGGPVAVTASAQGKQGAAQVSVVPRAVASVRVEPSTATLAVGRTSTLVAKAFDAQGNELPGRAASWSSGNDAIVTVAQTGAITGVAIGGPVGITATIEGHAGTSQVTVVEAAVASVTVSPSPTTVAASETVQLTAVLKDDQGNVLTGRAVLWTTSDPLYASVSNTGLVTGLLPGGPVTILATSEGRSGSSQVTVTAAVPARLAFVIQPSTTVAGALIAPSVQVEIQNALGNRVTSSTANVTIALGANPGPDGLTPVTVAAVNGVATFVGLSLSRTGEGYTLVATSPGLEPATSNPFNVIAGNPAALAFRIQPSDVVAGTAISPAIEVEVLDALGNRVTASSTPVTLAIGANPGGATPTGTLTLNAANGIAAFGDIMLDKAASGYTLTAESPGLAGATSSAFAVTPGPAASLRFLVPPSSVIEGQPITPAVQVEVRDAQGNRVTNAPGPYIITMTVQSSNGGSPPSGTTLSGTVTADGRSGVATFSNLVLAVSRDRTVTLRATAGSLSVLSNTFAVIAL